MDYTCSILGNMFRAALSFLAGILPSGTLGFIYTKVLSAPPLRALTNKILLLIIPACITIPEGVIYLNPADPVISGALSLGVYEPFETALFRRLLKPGMVVLDIGANVGYYTVIAAHLVGATGRVVAFEPEPTNVSFLNKNIKSNMLTQATVRAMAVAERAGRMTLNISATNKGNHSLVSTRAQSKQFTSSIEVPVERVDDALAEVHITNVDIIKIDVEGAEMLAFAGMQQTLTQPDMAICMEFYPELLRRAGSKPEALLVLIQKNGFEIYEMNEKSSDIILIKNLSAFAGKFAKGEYSNLLCLKGSFLKFQIR